MSGAYGWTRTAPAVLFRRGFRSSLLMPLLHAYAKLDVEGLEHLDGLDQPVIISSNHRSHADTVVLLGVLPRRWRRRTIVGAAADVWFANPAMSVLSALAIGGYPIDRHKASAAGARLTFRLLDDGWNVILYPEGGRSRDNQLLPMKPGAAFAATHSGRPMLPVWMEGTEVVLAPDQGRLRRGRVIVRIGPALHPTEGERPRAFHARFEEALLALRDGREPSGTSGR